MREIKLYYFANTCFMSVSGIVFMLLVHAFLNNCSIKNSCLG